MMRFKCPQMPKPPCTHKPVSVHLSVRCWRVMRRVQLQLTTSSRCFGALSNNPPPKRRLGVWVC